MSYKKIIKSQNHPCYQTNLKFFKVEAIIANTVKDGLTKKRETSSLAFVASGNCKHYFAV